MRNATTYIAALLTLADVASAATFDVNSLADSSDAAPGDGACLTAGGDCTFRAAIEEVNARENLTSDFDDITFSVAGGISPFSPLPVLTGRFGIIDGTTAPGYVASSDLGDAPPRIVLDGSFTTGTALQVDTFSPPIISALSIVDFSGSGIFVATDSSAIVVRCWIGLNNGGFASANGFGITLNGVGFIGTTGVSPTAAEGNLISGNSGDALRLRTGSAGSEISGNWIGVSTTGNSALPNGAGISGTGDDLAIGRAGFGNVVSGNNGLGVSLLSTNASLTDNIIGLPRSGIGSLPNTDGGVSLLGSALTVSNNFISGNGDTGLTLVATSSTVMNNLLSSNAGLGLDESGGGLNRIESNLIQFNTGGGADIGSDGTTVELNTFSENDGVDLIVSGDSNLVIKNAIRPQDINDTLASTGIRVTGVDNQIGSFFVSMGTFVSEGNTVFGHEGPEIEVLADDNRLSANAIGRGNSSGASLADDAGIGIRVFQTNGTLIEAGTVYSQSEAAITIAQSVNTRIESNGISGPVSSPNGADGIVIADSSDTSTILRNSIYDVGGTGVAILNTTSGRHEISQNQITGFGELAIDLDGDGRTLNDAGDIDLGINNLQNFPILGNADYDEQAGEVTFDVTVPTNGPNAVFPLTIEFYEPFGNVQSGPDDLGFRLQTVAYDTPNAVQSVTLSVSSGKAVSAVAIDADGNTSEASDPLVFGAGDALFNDGFETP